jgi:hypothetical protein
LTINIKIAPNYQETDINDMTRGLENDEDPEDAKEFEEVKYVRNFEDVEDDKDDEDNEEFQQEPIDAQLKMNFWFIIL